MKRHVFAAAVGALLLVLPVRHALRADSALYTVEDLGQFGGLAPIVTGKNASGQMSGYVTATDTGLPRAVRYTAETGWEYVSGVSTFFSQAMGINDNGEIVGSHFDAAGFRAFRWLPGTGHTNVGLLPGGTMTLGRAIDSNGNVYGQADSADGVRAFRAAPGLHAEILPSLGGTAVACGVNAAGQIAGFGSRADGQQRAFRIETNGDVTEIVPLDGPGGSIDGCAIDEAGRVGGRSTGGSTYRAFVFASGPAVNVDTFASDYSQVESLKNGVAAGWFLATADGMPRAFVNTADGSAELNGLIATGTGWQLDQAFLVEANGSIIGIGRLNGVPRAFRLNRVAASDTTAPVITALSASPSSIDLPNNAMVTVTVTATATDNQDPSPVCSITGIDGHGAAATDFSVLGPLTGWVRARGGATYTFAVACTDASGNTTSGSVDVVVPPDTTAPVISNVSANPSTIWPPNGSLVPVTVTVTASDNVDASPSCSLSSINVVPSAGPDDYMTTGALTAKVRAIGGRTYTLVVTCRDAAGNATSSAVAVVVPPDTTAPVLQSVTATPGAIWPPNGKMVHVDVAISATDNVDALPQCSVKAVYVSGGVASDGVVTGTYTVSVRAEKDRSYTIKVVCRDVAGNASYGSTTVVVANKEATLTKGLVQGKKLLALLKNAAAGKAAANAKRYFSRGSSR